MIKYLEKEEDYQSSINNDLVLVDFYADWCGPCKMLGSVLEEIESINILKVNVDKYSDIAQQYGVMSIPTICFFEKGKLLKKEIGYRTLTELNEIIESIKKEVE